MGMYPILTLLMEFHAMPGLPWTTCWRLGVKLRIWLGKSILFSLVIFSLKFHKHMCFFVYVDSIFGWWFFVHLQKLWFFLCILTLVFLGLVILNVQEQLLIHNKNWDQPPTNRKIWLYPRNLNCLSWNPLRSILKNAPCGVRYIAFVLGGAVFVLTGNTPEIESYSFPLGHTRNTYFSFLAGHFWKTT